MGYDASAVCLIGVRVDPDKLDNAIFRKEMRRSCIHAIQEGSNYCGQCGKPKFEKTVTAIKEYGGDDIETLCGYKLVGHSGIGEKRFIAYDAIDAGANDPRGRTLVCGIINLEAIHDEMAAKLIPLGLWNGADFGIHVFLDESA